MGRIAYDDLAPVYDYLVPEPLLTPEGNVAMFEEQLALIEPGAPVLDCACGTGMVAVGLAKRGFEVTATDASPAMVERTKALAKEHQVELDARTCPWEELTVPSWPSHFKAVFCVGNSLTHAADRRAALRAMHDVAAEQALLVVTSRNWERVRATASDSLEHVRGATVRHAWHLADEWDQPHHMDIEVALEDAVYRERLTFWPFTHDALHDDLRAAGFEPRSSSWARDADRYLVTASRASSRSR